MLSRYLPLAGLLVIFAAAFGWRPWLHRRRYGNWGIVLFRSGNAWQHVRDGLLVVAFLLLLWQAVAAAAGRGAVRASGGALALAGGALMAAAIALLLVALLHMGASWRIGIDRAARPGLVRTGLFRHSRNPIYAALLAGILGYALLLPTVLSWAVLAGALLGIGRQVRAEERYLAEAYGDAFRDYAARVPRYFRGAAPLAVALGVAIVAVALSHGQRVAAIGTAYAAKVMCSGVFVSGREAAAVLDNDVAVDDLAVMRRFSVRVDRDARVVHASLFGLFERTAAFREGLGCALFRGSSPAVRADPRPAETLQTRLDPRLVPVLDWAFAEADAAKPRRTRAVVVLHNGHVVAERYAEGFTRDTPLPGWSMAKSVTGALVGILVGQGRAALADRAPVPEWQMAGDARQGITLGHLLHMSSGLRFDEDYADPLSHVTRMLLAAPSAGGFAAAMPLDHAPGTHWAYASGTTNIVTYALRGVVGETGYAAFPRRALFDRIGMTGAVMETDASGTFVGSSFMYATARDWARFGLLYLRDGVWSGERILPEGWVAWSRTPAPAAPGGIYGGHFWLRLHAGASCRPGEPPPADAFHASGHEGQHLTIIPSRDLVLVRLGMTRYPCAWDQREFITRVLKAM